MTYNVFGGTLNLAQLNLSSATFVGPGRPGCDPNSIKWNNKPHSIAEKPARRHVAGRIACTVCLKWWFAGLLRCTLYTVMYCGVLVEIWLIAITARSYILLHCNASNLMLEILKRDKMWGICISVPHSKFWGRELSYARVLAPVIQQLS